MEHFQKEDWFLYCQGQLKEEKELLMDEHLTKCEQCLETFLCLISEDEIAEAQGIVPFDFADRVMATINQEKTKSEQQKTNTQQKNLFVYYLAVSVITIILMGNGFFQSLVDAIPKIAAPSEKREEQRLEVLNLDWSGKLVDQISTWIYNFETEGRS